MWNCQDSINGPENLHFDFFITLTDQIDDCLQKKIKKSHVFKPVFEGLYSNQLICHDCEHAYERQESFLPLNLSVKTFSNTRADESIF